MALEMKTECRLPFEWRDSASETWVVSYAINPGALNVVGMAEGMKTSRTCSVFKGLG